MGSTDKRRCQDEGSKEAANWNGQGMLLGEGATEQEDMVQDARDREHTCSEQPIGESAMTQSKGNSNP